MISDEEVLLRVKGLLEKRGRRPKALIIFGSYVRSPARSCSGRG